MPDADYNVAPTTHQPIVRQNRETGERALILARWGLVPFFTKDLKCSVRCSLSQVCGLFGLWHAFGDEPVAGVDIDA